MAAMAESAAIAQSAAVAATLSYEEDSQGDIEDDDLLEVDDTDQIHIGRITAVETEAMQDHDIESEEQVEHTPDVDNIYTSENDTGEDRFTSEDDTDKGEEEAVGFGFGHANEQQGNVNMAFQPHAATLLREWLNANHVPHNAVDQLLHILKEVNPASIQELPLTARTFLKTMRNCETHLKSGMEYINCGVKSSIAHNFQHYPIATQAATNLIPISLNVDGMSPFNSSSKCMWPMLCAIQLKPTIVFPLYLSFGPSKPTGPEYLEETIRELCNIIEDGINIGDHWLVVQLKSIVCDAQATSFVKCTTQSNGYGGCDKCTDEGVYVQSRQELLNAHRRGRISHQELDNLELRTDESFLQKSDQSHHIAGKLSPFVELPIYTNKIGDCLFICLFIYLSVCSAMGGQTARPNGLKFGG